MLSSKALSKFDNSASKTHWCIYSATPGVSVVRAGVKAREPRDLRRFWAAQSFQSFEFNRFNRLSVDVDSSIMPGGGEKVSRCGSTNFGRQRPREATGSRGRRVRPARPRESRLLCVCRDCVIHTRDPHSARTVGAKAYASDGQPQHLRAAGHRGLRGPLPRCHQPRGASQLLALHRVRAGQRCAGRRAGLRRVGVHHRRAALEAVPAFEAGRALWAINVCVNSREILCLENATSSKL